jgi:NitT/TauT family transport system substrate-binding protein
MRRLFIGLTATAVLVSVTACGSSEPAAKASSSGGGTTAIKVGVIPIVDVAPIYLGKKKGFYRDQGLDLTLQTAQGGAVIVPGVVSGEFQFGFSNATSLMIAQTNNVPLKAVANGVATTGKEGADYSGITVKKGSPIKSPKDLEGKQVAVNTLKNIGDTSVRESVRKAGGDPAKVKFVELPLDQMPAALDGGRIDAAWAVEPTLATIKAQGGTVIGSNYVDVSPDLTVALYFASTPYIQKNPGLVKKFQTATAKSLEYANGHPDEIRQVLTEYTKIPQATLQQMILPRWPAEPNRASLDKLAQLGEQDRIFTSKPDLDKLLP